MSCQPCPKPGLGEPWAASSRQLVRQEISGPAPACTCVVGRGGCRATRVARSSEALAAPASLCHGEASLALVACEQHHGHEVQGQTQGPAWLLAMDHVLLGPRLG